MNDAKIIGTMSTPEFDHELNGDRIFRATITTCRLSGITDTIPVLMASYLAESVPNGGRVYAQGEFRSHNTKPDAQGKKHLLLYLYVRGIWETQPTDADDNQIVLEGYVCKSPVKRTTPGGRIITDLLVAVPRTNIVDRSDYLPVVCWGNNIPALVISDCVRIRGRIQSREYGKGIAYEVSCIDISNICAVK